MSFAAWLTSRYEEKGALKWAAFLLDLVAAVVLFALMVLTCIDVVGRYFFSRPLVGATELTEIGLAVVIFAAMPVITWRGGQIVVDLVDMFVSPKVLQVLALISTLLMTASLYFVAWRIYDLGARNLKRGIVTDFLFIPTGLVIQYIAILSWITAAGLILQLFIQVIHNKKSTAAGVQQ